MFSILLMFGSSLKSLFQIWGGLFADWASSVGAGVLGLVHAS